MNDDDEDDAGSLLSQRKISHTHNKNKIENLRARYDNIE